MTNINYILHLQVVIMARDAAFIVFGYIIIGGYLNIRYGYKFGDYDKLVKHRTIESIALTIFLLVVGFILHEYVL